MHAIRDRLEAFSTPRASFYEVKEYETHKYVLKELQYEELCIECVGHFLEKKH